MENPRDRRSSRRSKKADSPLVRLPYRNLHNRWMPYEFLDAGQVEQLHQASLHILENTGIAFMDDEALDLWAHAGAQVERSSRMVRIPGGMLMELIAKAPSTFTWRARNPERSVPIGGDVVAFAPHGGMVYASSLDTGRRPGTLADFKSFVKLSQVCSVLNFNGGELIAIQDVNPSERHLKRLYTDFTLTDKALIEAAHGRIISKDVIDMAALVFDGLEGDPVLGGVINVSSPLRYDERMTGGLITFARHGQVNIITPFILAGAMSPLTTAAALTQQNAEALAGIALTQLVRPGSPVIYGGFTTNVDMKSGSPAFGTPEGAWAMFVGARSWRAVTTCPTAAAAA